MISFIKKKKLTQDYFIKIDILNLGSVAFNVLRAKLGQGMC